MMATVPHVTSGSGLRKFQADGFLLDRVYMLRQRKSMTQRYISVDGETTQKGKQFKM